MKCFNPAYLGSFHIDGAQLRDRGINRIGNTLVPNKNYCDFENWMSPLLDELVEEQRSTGEIFSPSKIIERMGKKIDNPESIWYWCYKVRMVLRPRC